MLAERVRFVEITYPRTLTWSLDDYAAAVEQSLAEHGIDRGWLLGESFGSQIVWAMAGRKTSASEKAQVHAAINQGSVKALPCQQKENPGRFTIQGLILAGGFVRHPARWAVRIVGLLAGILPQEVLKVALWIYAKLARLRYGHSSLELAEIDEFVARRTDLDRRAARHRLRLIAENNPCDIASHIEVPVYAITGSVDPLVPWFCVRPWLKKRCRNLRQYRIVALADHNVLATAPRLSAEQIVTWIRS